MLEVLAAAFEDGWAFVLEEDRRLLVRPPYKNARLVEVSASTVERAISTQGFQPVGVKVDTWPELIDFLQRKLVESAAERPASSEPVALRLLRRAPRDVLESYLERIEKELIPGKEWRAAVDLLNALLDLDLLAEDSKLHGRAQGLLRRCVIALVAREQGRKSMLVDEAGLRQQFPVMSSTFDPRYVQARMQDVRQDGQLLRMTG